MSNIPHEFCIDKYSVCKQWGSYEWCHAIDSRLWARKAIDKLLSGEFEKEYRNEQNHLQRISDVLYLAKGDTLEEKIKATKDSCLHLITELGYAACGSDKRRFYAESYKHVSPLSLEVAFYIHEQFIEWTDTSMQDGEGHESELSRMMRILKGPCPSEASELSITEKAYDEYMAEDFLGIKKDGSGEVLGYAYIMADLSVSDDTLIKQFADLLPEIRLSLNWPASKRPFTSEDFNSWTEEKLMPYFDLVALSRLYGKTLTSAEIGAALFPDEYNVDLSSRIRRTTKPKSDRLFSYATVHSLRGQA